MAICFGSYTLSAAGVCIYTHYNSNATVLPSFPTRRSSDLFTATTVDGTAKLVTITIHGTEDTAVIGGDITGARLEAHATALQSRVAPAATGNLNSTDVDNPSDAWTAVGTATASSKGYGSYT